MNKVSTLIIATLVGAALLPLSSSANEPMLNGKFLRVVVTGLSNEEGSVIVSDGPPDLILQSGPGSFMGDLWRTAYLPSTNQDGSPPTTYSLEPEGAGGLSFRIASIPPQTIQAQPKNPSKEFAMHQTDTIDFITIISGEIFLKLDDGSETLLKAGDSLVQRGTNHAWINRGNVPCVFSAVMVKPAIATLNATEKLKTEH